MNDDASATQRDVLTRWLNRVTSNQRAHYSSATLLARRNQLLGVPVIGLSTLVGTSVFASLQQQTSLWMQVAAGTASVAAAVLASFQTFFGFAERAERHRVAGASYGAIGRELEELLGAGEPDLEAALPRLRERMDKLALEAPNNPEAIRRRAKTLAS